MAQGFKTPQRASELNDSTPHSDCDRFCSVASSKLIEPIEDGFLLLTAKAVREDFAQDLSPEEQRILTATQGATQGAILSTVIPSAAWHTKPSWFVIASNDRTISPEQEAFTAKRMRAKTLTLASSHVAMLAKPKEVADFIIEASASVNAVRAAS